MNLYKFKKSKLSYFFIFIVGLVLFLITWDNPVGVLKEKYANEQSKFIEIRGMQVHYRDEGSGMPVVLIHGTGASLHTWNDWAEELKKDYRVIRLDLPAFGLTGPDSARDYTIPTYSDFLNDFLSALAIDSIYLGGNSLGGNVAWYYASEYPQKVRKLLLIDPLGYPSDREIPWIFTLAKIPVLNWIIRYMTPKSMIKDNLEQVYFDDSKITPKLVERYYDLTIREGNRQAFIDAAKTEMKDYSDRLSSITTPTLILWGKEDIWIPVSDGSKFLNSLPNAELIVFDNIGHVPMEESPAESLVPTKNFFEQ